MPAPGFVLLALLGAFPRGPGDDGPAAAPAAADPARAALEAALDRAVEPDPTRAFWGAVLVARRGEVLLSKGYGCADYLERPNTPATLFDIASLSKQFTAAAVLKLEMQGKFALDDPIAKHFEGVPEDKRGISVRHLLTHTSGLRQTSRHDERSPGQQGVRAQWTQHLLRSTLWCAPGEAFLYCNYNYLLLAELVDTLCDVGFEAYLESTLFEPAGLKSTGFVQESRLPSTLQSLRSPQADSKGLPASIETWGWGFRGATGVISSTADLLRWHVALQGDAILDAHARETLRTPFRGLYACGWYVEPDDSGRQRMYHDGIASGYRTYMSRFPDEDVLIVVLSNERHAPREIDARLRALLFPAEPAPERR